MVYQPVDAGGSVFIGRKKTGIRFVKRYDGLCSHINSKKVNCSQLAGWSHAFECKFGKEAERDVEFGGSRKSGVRSQESGVRLRTPNSELRTQYSKASFRITTTAFTFTKSK